MALSTVGGGQQIIPAGSDIVMGYQVPPTTLSVTTTATLTTAQLLGGMLVIDPGTGAAACTLPTVALTEAVITNARTNSTFDLVVINLGTSSGVVTIAAGTGWTLVGMVTLPITTSAGSSARFRALKTGSGAWTLYRVA